MHKKYIPSQLHPLLSMHTYNTHAVNTTHAEYNTNNTHPSLIPCVPTYTQTQYILTYLFISHVPHIHTHHIHMTHITEHTEHIFIFCMCSIHPAHTHTPFAFPTHTPYIIPPNILHHPTNLPPTIGKWRMEFRRMNCKVHPSYT